MVQSAPGRLLLTRSPGGPLTLAAGTRLGPYEITSPIGAGGMGEVYKARDTRLDRTVAIKVLPAAVAGNPERRARFQREAKTVAALNHPHICALHDVGDHGSAGSTQAAMYLVMEYIDGETLAQRLRKGPLPLEQALTVATEIADALAAAHRQHVTHRDLKPSNVMLTKTGAKLLDFGLAKLKVPDSDARFSSLTTQEPGTAQGTVLGTVPYMAPEQLEGKEADARSDIFSFGALLYEMLTGRRAFQGESGASVISAIMSAEPAPISSLRPATPPSLDRLVKRCVAKDPDDRWDSAHDIADELRWIADAEASQAVKVPVLPARVRWLLGAATTVLLVGVIAWIITHAGPPAAPGSKSLALTMPAGVTFAPYQSVVFSPDGTAVVYVGASDEASISRLYWHDLDEAEGQPISGTDGASQPFFSPDGGWLGFIRAGKLVKVQVRSGRIVEGSPPVELADATADWTRGVSWGDSGIILYSPQPVSGGLWRVSSNGGPARQLTRPDTSKGEMSHRWPCVLPGGHAALFTALDASGRQDHSAIEVVSLDTGRVTRLFGGGSNAVYVSTGHIVYGRNGSLLAVRFDPEKLTTDGSPTPVLNGVAMESYGGPGNVSFAVSSTGALVYATAPALPENRLVWVNHDGQAEPVVPEPRAYVDFPTLSPDGQTMVVEIEADTFTNLWSYDLNSRRWQQLTFEGDNMAAAWTPAGDRIAFSSNRNGAFNLYVMSADGQQQPERLTQSANWQFPYSWSPDGQFLAFQEQESTAGWNTWVLPVQGDRKPWRWGPEGVGATVPAFSRDGQWIAYQSQESGQWDVYLRPFRGPGPRVRVSGASGGRAPVWSRDGHSLLYLDGTRIMAASVESGTPLRPSPPHLVFALPFTPNPGGNPNHAAFRAVTPDGQRVAVVQWQQQMAPVIHRLLVIPNWVEELKTKAPGRD